ncbi:MAG: hypothetical protein KF750_04450 [Xanthobacteraceae bacterium]|nr:hypothetical protein [Xanthobacteraceae bacterium]
MDFVKSLFSALPTETEFWSAIAGAIVGGMIALVAQLIAIRATRKQITADKLDIQKTLCASIIFKLIRIHTNILGVYSHIEGCLSGAKQRGLVGDPWQFVTPLINPPGHVHFNSDEMAMLLGLKDFEVFNAVLSLDVVHNSHIDSLRVLSSERRALTDRLEAEEANGVMLSGTMSHEQMMRLKPKMIEVNTLVEQMKERTKKDSSLAFRALDQVNMLFREKLGLTYRVELDPSWASKNFDHGIPDQIPKP